MNNYVITDNPDMRDCIVIDFPKLEENILFEIAKITERDTYLPVDNGVVIFRPDGVKHFINNNWIE